jgi:hypothetical protein
MQALYVVKEPNSKTPPTIKNIAAKNAKHIQRGYNTNLKL